MRLRSISGAAAGLSVLLALSACAPSASPSPSTTASNGPLAASSASAAPSAIPAARDLAWYGLPQADDLFRGAAIASMAGGPSGFVVLGNDRATGGLISWTSADGDGWVRHWVPGATFGGGTPGWLVGGAFGYLALGWKIDGADVSRALWSSSDGVDWALAPATGLPAGQMVSLISGPSGAAVTFDFAERGAAVATSRDGRAWTLAALPPDAVPRIDGVVALPQGFFVVGSVEGTDPNGQPTSADSAWRTADGTSWTADPRLGEELAKLPNSIERWQVSPWGTVGVGNATAVVVTANGLEAWPLPPDTWGQLVGGPAGLLWIKGGDRTSSCSAGWRFAADGWQPLAATHNDSQCLDAASPQVIGSASIATGMLMISQLGSTADRTAWLVRAPGMTPNGVATGGPVPTPPAEALPDPLAATIERPAACPSTPTTIGSALALTPQTAVGCFGDRTLSFRAWVVDPGEGYGGTCAVFTPAWIRECVLPDYLLAAGPPNAEGQLRLHAMKAPNATGTTKGVGRWVRVQGHYDDPVSPSCRGAGDFGSVSLEPELPRALAVLNCRLVFVVADIRTVK